MRVKLIKKDTFLIGIATYGSAPLTARGGKILLGGTFDKIRCGGFSRLTQFAQRIQRLGSPLTAPLLINIAESYSNFPVAMNLASLHASEKPVSAVALIKGQLQAVTAIRIFAGETLKEHTTPVPAMLVCIAGKAIYSDESGREVMLEAGDYTPIEAHVKHKVAARSESQFLLIR